MYSTQTQTATYTVIDIRKAFEGFDADLRMIAKRTGKWSTETVEKYLHDVIKLAEEKYINYVDITLLNNLGSPLRATRYKVNESGNALHSDRPGGNDWSDIPGTRLSIIISLTSRWHALSLEAQKSFQVNNGFKINWVDSSIDTTYPHLRPESNQLYASKGFEVQKTTYK